MNLRRIFLRLKHLNVTNPINKRHVTSQMKLNWNHRIQFYRFSNPTYRSKISTFILDGSTQGYSLFRQCYNFNHLNCIGSWRMSDVAVCCYLMMMVFPNRLNRYRNHVTSSLMRVHRMNDGDGNNQQKN